MDEKKKTVNYIEPAEYFPENLRKKYKLGEYADLPESDEKDEKEN